MRTSTRLAAVAATAAVAVSGAAATADASTLTVDLGARPTHVVTLAPSQQDTDPHTASGQQQQGTAIRLGGRGLISLTWWGRHRGTAPATSQPAVRTASPAMTPVAATTPAGQRVQQVIGMPAVVQAP